MVNNEQAFQGFSGYTSLLRHRRACNIYNNTSDAQLFYFFTLLFFNYYFSFIINRRIFFLRHSLTELLIIKCGEVELKSFLFLERKEKGT